MAPRRIGQSEGGGKSADPAMMKGLSADAIDERVAANSKDKVPLSSTVAAMREQRLQEAQASKSAGAAAGPGPKPSRQAKFEQQPEPAPPPPPPIDKSHCLDMIQAYKERFPHLKSRNAKLTARSSEEEIQDELYYIQMQLGSNGSDGSAGCMILHTAMVGIETSTTYFNPLNLQLQGLGEVTRQNMSQFQPIIDELMIKYTTGFSMGPETRLVLHIGALVMTVHAANTGSPALQEALRRTGAPVNTDTVKAAEGL